MKKILLLLVISLYIISSYAQTALLSGKVRSGTEPLPFAQVYIQNTSTGTTTDSTGHYQLHNIPPGKHTIIISLTGYQTQQKLIHITTTQTHITLNFNLKESLQLLSQIVVTGTKTSKKQTDTPIIVNVIDKKTLNNTQACTLSEGLKFQSGLRVETNCQTCNYTQLRMNGLGGAYSQILINSRPIFSSLTGLYGLEQIPTNMIERIEIIKGGGSSLYGSNAIGGTVNIITRIPQENTYDLSYTYQNINSQASDHIMNANATLLNKNKKMGSAVFFNHRNRAYYDHNNDNFSELPMLRNFAAGANLFFKPHKNDKLEISLNGFDEYRYGGEMIDQPAHLSQQAEERKHAIIMGSIDYQRHFNHNKTTLLTYLAAQNTNRKHYTGIFPDENLDISQHLSNPPYGNSKNTTFQAGAQINHRLYHFLGGNNILTFGTEYLLDDVSDLIEAYQYEVNQTTQNWGTFMQSDWEIIPQINLLVGMRLDQHNLLDRPIISPRASLLYKLKESTQFRITWGTGFRAPQAFDTDLHLAFAGGGISRISLSPDLVQERSQSLNASINYDKTTKLFIAGFTAEVFHTHLQNAFYLYPLGTDAFGERFEKRNGTGASVAGASIEIRANYNKKVQLEAGYTLQRSLYDYPVTYLEGLEDKRIFLRTPNQYGYTTLSATPNTKFNTTLSLIYTGKMELMHLAGAPEQTTDSYKTTPHFTEVNLKIGYTFALGQSNSGIEIFGSIKNISNAYQNDFDTGKNRDSNYVYGPLLPRTFFIGLHIKSL